MTICGDLTCARGRVSRISSQGYYEQAQKMRGECICKKRATRWSSRIPADPWVPTNAICAHSDTPCWHVVADTWHQRCRSAADRDTDKADTAANRPWWSSAWRSAAVRSTRTAHQNSRHLDRHRLSYSDRKRNERSTCRSACQRRTAPDIESLIPRPADIPSNGTVRIAYRPSPAGRCRQRLSGKSPQLSPLLGRQHRICHRCRKTEIYGSSGPVPGVHRRCRRRRIPICRTGDLPAVKQAGFRRQPIRSSWRAVEALLPPSAWHAAAGRNHLPAMS